MTPVLRPPQDKIAGNQIYIKNKSKCDKKLKARRTTTKQQRAHQNIIQTASIKVKQQDKNK